MMKKYYQAPKSAQVQIPEIMIGVYNGSNESGIYVPQAD